MELQSNSLCWVKNANMEKEIVLRKATMDDAKLLFQWKNDPETIANSITKRGVTMEEHMNWLGKVVDNPKRQLYILEIDQVPVGQLRLDIEYLERAGDAVTLGGDKQVTAITAEISYGLAAEHRGKGLGKILLEQAELIAQVYGFDQLTAEVLPHNLASQKLFKKLGYVEEQKENLYVYTKSYC